MSKKMLEVTEKLEVKNKVRRRKRKVGSKKSYI